MQTQVCVYISFSFSMEKEKFRFIVVHCFDLGLTVPMCLCKPILSVYMCKVVPVQSTAKRCKLKQS